jgi:hypothetical protein
VLPGESAKPNSNHFPDGTEGILVNERLSDRVQSLVLTMALAPIDGKPPALT